MKWDRQKRLSHYFLSRPGKLRPLVGESSPNTSSGPPAYGNNPNTTTLFGVPTYTLPFATIGTMYLLSAN